MQFLKDLAFPTVALIIGSIMLLLAIVKKIKTKFVEFPEIKTKQQRLLLGIAGGVLIFDSIALQFITFESSSSDALTSAQSTISALEAQLTSSITTIVTPSLFAAPPTG